MNCPGHIQIFKNGLKSYRDLPLKIAEFGKVHRFEPSGALHGLMRVRAFTQDDAHVFITEEQIAEECLKINDLILSIYEDFGFDDVRIKFSDRPEKRIGDDAVWDKAEAALMQALGSLRPAVDAQQGRRRVLRAEARIRAARRHRPRLAVRHHAGRSQPAGPARRVLHRRALQQGDAGDAAPRDVRLARALHRHPDRALCRPLPAVARRRCRRWSRPSRRTPTTTRARSSRRRARAGLRVESDLRNEKINYKVREHSLAKVPVLLVVGKKEAAERTVSIRRLGSEGQQVMPLDAALAALADEAVPPDVQRMEKTGVSRQPPVSLPRQHLDLAVDAGDDLEGRARRSCRRCGRWRGTRPRRGSRAGTRRSIP